MIKDKTFFFKALNLTSHFCDAICFENRSLKAFKTTRLREALKLKYGIESFYE